MRSLWKPSSKTIGGIQCIELKTTAFDYDNIEYCLASRNGEIWEVGSGVWAAVLKPKKHKNKAYSERLIRFGDSKLQEVIALLDIPLDPKDQTPWANGFSRK